MFNVIGTVIWFVLSLPVRIALAFRFSAIFTISGFIVGILSGLIAGYFAFIYTEPDDYQEPKLIRLSDESLELSLEEKKRFFRLLPPWVHTPDVERISWLNKMLALVWPFIDKAVAAEVLSQTQPIIKENKPKFVESIDFDSLTLGQFPPTIIGIKSFETMEDEVIIQPELRWIARPNIKVVVRVFGMQLTAHLTHLHIQAPARITLKPLSNYFPCFSKIVVSLMLSPSVDVGLSILGMDFLAIPFLNRLVEAQVESAVGDLLLWPAAMTIYEEDPLPVKGKLYIQEIRATNLRNVAGLVAKIDPYVKFGFGRKVGNFQTREKKDDTSPIWDLEGVVGVHDRDTQELLVQVYHKKGRKPILIGETKIPLSYLEDNVPRKFEENLVEKLPEEGKAGEAKDSGVGLDKGKTMSKRSSLARPKSSRTSVGGISFTLTYKPRLEHETEGDDDLDEGGEVVIPEDVKVGGGVLWVKLRSGRDLVAKKAGYDTNQVIMKYKGVENKSQKTKETDIEMFEDLPMTWICEKKPDKDILHVKVVAEAKVASLATVKNPMALKRLLHSQEAVGHVEIPLRDVVSNGRTLDDYSLVGSQGASLKIEIKWAEKTEKSAASLSKPEAPAAPAS